MNCLHIYTGTGKGKTTAAVGLAVRSLGCGNKVVFCQFFKNGSSGEVKALQTFENLTYLKSEKAMPRFVNMTEEQKQGAEDMYMELFERAVQNMPENGLIVFDELISTYNYGFLNKERVVEVLKKATETCEVVITGRNPSNELCEIADYISDVQKVKHPYDKGIIARRGVEF